MEAKRGAPEARAGETAHPAAPTTPEGELLEAGLYDVLGYRVAQAMVACHSSFMRVVGTPHELRPAEYSVLCLIAQNPGASPSRLASALALNKPNLTVWLDRLAARELIERRPSPTDGRAFALFATTAGDRLATQATAALVDAEHRQFDGLSKAERAMLTELLHKLAAQR